MRMIVMNEKINIFLSYIHDFDFGIILLGKVNLDIYGILSQNLAIKSTLC